MSARRLLYIGCLGYGNVGDEACLEGARRGFEPRLPPDWEFAWLNGYDFHGDEEFDALILGGGTLLSPHGNLGDAALREARSRGTPYYVFATGLESRDWEGSPDEETTAAFADLVSGATLIGVRGPMSRDYLVQLGVPADRIEVVGDAAVLLDGVPASAPVPEGERRLAVNVGTSFDRVFGRDEGAMQDTLVEALGALAAEGWGICFFPVWDRDLEIQRDVERRLRERNVDRVVSIETVLDPASMIDFVANFDAVLAMKLHAGVLAAVAGVPYLPWAYRPKVTEFASTVGLQEFVVQTDASAEHLGRSLRSLWERREDVTRTMSGDLAAMRQRLERFATEIVDRLPG